MSTELRADGLQGLYSMCGFLYLKMVDLCYILNFTVESIQVFECRWCICLLKYEHLPLVDDAIIYGHSVSNRFIIIMAATLSTIATIV